MPPAFPCEVIVDEKTGARLTMEKKASELSIKGNIPGMKDATLEKKIAEVKDKVHESKPVPDGAMIIVGKNACKGKFGIAGKTFGPGEKIILTKADMENRNTSARVDHGKKIGMIK